ncbi:DegT/DnrJ/EryC1/StrS family aminotransferase [Microlunatus sp. Y2014]|uniref:DegT/DnrJ/EryC1/StrS family aminotransferase n=1 Tax=Microlunatus sp. Y2014 TaxID=3418488 RepID=UPI003DA6DF53
MEALAVHGGRPSVTFNPTWPIFGAEEEQALSAVLRSGKWGSTSGDVVATFEDEFADKFGVRHATAVANGTLALVAALGAAGVGSGDEVIVPPYTFIATASAALLVGAIPVFADVRPDNHMIDADSVRSRITDRTRAIIPVHLAGGVADMESIMAVADQYGLIVIEDCAQATGASRHGVPVGGLGHLGAFSFQSSKNLTAGEGGAVLTNDDDLAEKLYGMVNVGRRRGGGWYEHATIGYNLRLTEFQAAVLRCQLQRFDELQGRLDRGARLLTSQLAGVSTLVVDAEDESWTSHGRHGYLIRVPACTGRPNLRDAAVAALRAEGVTSASGGYVPLHRNDALLERIRQLTGTLDRNDVDQACPVADEVCSDTIWLPHQWLSGSQDEIGQVANALARVTSQLETL